MMNRIPLPATTVLGKWSILTWLVVMGLFTAVVTACSGNNKDMFFTENAALQYSKVHERLKDGLFEYNDIDALLKDNYIVSGHRIKKGRNLILAYRLYNKELGLDKNSFEKLSISIEGNKNKETVILNKDTSNIVFYSRGSSSFPKRGCYGYAKSGSVVYRKYSQHIDVTLSIYIQLTPTKKHLANLCKPFELNKSIIFKRKDINVLTPWEGVAGENVLEESHKGRKRRVKESKRAKKEKGDGGIK